MAENAPVVQPVAAGQGDQQPQRTSGWQMMKSLGFQMLLFYLITSYFRGGKQPATNGPDGEVVVPGLNLYPIGQEMVSIRSND